MAILDTVAPKRQTFDGPKGSNKIKISDRTREAEIVYARIFNVTVTKNGDRHTRKFTKDESPDKNIAVGFRLDVRPDIVLQREFPLHLGKNAAFAQFLESVTGLRAGSDEQRAFDTDDLLSDRYKLVLITTKHFEDSGYTNVMAVTPRPKADDVDDLAEAPAHHPEPPKIVVDPVAVKRRLTALLRSPELEPWEVQKAIAEVTGVADKSSIKAPEIALSVCERLESVLEAARDEVPF